jgi:hypothetical protein
MEDVAKVLGKMESCRVEALLEFGLKLGQSFFEHAFVQPTCKKKKNYC